MKSPTVVTGELQARLDKRWHVAITGDAGGDWPLRVPLGEPSRTVLEADFPAAQRWARTWAEWAAALGLELERRTRLVRGTSQPLPTHLIIPCADTAAGVCGQGWPERLAEARRRLTVLRDAFPAADHARVIRGAARLSGTDFSLLITAARWFTVHSAAGLTPRQVPLPGFHGKWLNTHHALISALSGKQDLGLARRPTRVHFTYLDPGHRTRGGRRHESITIGDSADPAYQPDMVIILENKDTAVYFPEVTGGIAVEGEGTKAPGTLPLVPWIRHCARIVYWGDIDAAGLCIVNDLRAAGIPAVSILMDYPTYQAFERYGAWTDDTGKPVPCSPRRNLTALTPGELQLYEALTDPCWPRVRRVEQERIPLQVGAAHVAVLAAGPEVPVTACAPSLRP